MAEPILAGQDEYQRCYQDSIIAMMQGKSDKSEQANVYNKESGPLTGGWTVLSSHKRFDVGWKMSELHEVPLIEQADFLGGKVTSDCGNDVCG
jgi:hypothetical protein